MIARQILRQFDRYMAFCVECSMCLIVGSIPYRDSERSAVAGFRSNVIAIDGNHCYATIRFRF